MPIKGSFLQFRRVAFLLVSVLISLSWLFWPSYISFSGRRISPIFTTNCSQTGSKWVVVEGKCPPFVRFTTFAASGWQVLLVGDDCVNRHDVVCLTTERQRFSSFNVARILPEGHPSRKNIGYLHAISCGAHVIQDVGCDLVPLTSDPVVLPETGLYHMLDAPGVYAAHAHQHAGVDGAPRGFPHNFANFVSTAASQQCVRVPIQQGLISHAPDLDGPVLSSSDLRDDISPVAFPQGTFTPINSLHTIWHRSSFWGLALPVTFGSLGDILRGYWTQRLLWEVGAVVGVSGATAQRPMPTGVDVAGSYSQDTGPLVKFLSNWRLPSSVRSLEDAFVLLMRDLVVAGHASEADAEVIQVWLHDLVAIGMPFPKLGSSPPNKDCPHVPHVVHTRKKNAWATILTAEDRGYLLLSRVLMGQIRAFSSDPVLALVYSDSSEFARAYLRRLGYDVRVIQEKYVPPYVPRCGDLGPYQDQFLKLYIWKLTEFDRVVYLDSDTLIAEPIDFLFDEDIEGNTLVGCHACGSPSWGLLGARNVINGALLVVKPSLATWDYILSFGENVPDEIRTSQLDCTEMGILNEAFAGIWRFPTHKPDSVCFDLYRYNHSPEYQEMMGTTNETRQIYVMHGMKGSKVSHDWYYSSDIWGNESGQRVKRWFWDPLVELLDEYQKDFDSFQTTWKYVH